MKLRILQSQPRHGIVDESNALLTIADLAERLHVTEAVITASINLEQLKPAARFGRSPGYWLSDVATAERNLRAAATLNFLKAIGRHTERGA